MVKSILTYILHVCNVNTYFCLFTSLVYDGMRKQKNVLYLYDCNKELSLESYNTNFKNMMSGQLENDLFIIYLI